MNNLVKFVNSPTVKAVGCEIVKACGAYAIVDYLVKNGFTKLKFFNCFEASK